MAGDVHEGEEHRDHHDERHVEGRAAEPTGGPPRRPRNWWKVLGITAGVLLLLAGLGFLGFVALVSVALSSWGSNK